MWVWCSLGAEAPRGEGATRCWETWGVVCVLTYAHTRSLTHFRSHAITHPRSHIPELWCGDLQEAWLTADGATINLFLRDKAALVVSTSMVLPASPKGASVGPPSISASLHVSLPCCAEGPTHFGKGGSGIAPPNPKEHGFSLQSCAHPWSPQLRAQSKECRVQD